MARRFFAVIYSEMFLNGRLCLDMKKPPCLANREIFQICPKKLKNYLFSSGCSSICFGSSLGSSFLEREKNTTIGNAVAIA